jgi:two-component system response regulator YesN
VEIVSLENGMGVLFVYRILIADDEAIERQGLELMITRAMPGMFEIFHAENGRVAIEKAEQEKPDIIFMDIKMPGIQGIDALKEIIRNMPHVKTVLVTAYDYFGYAKEALTLGVNDYLLKPKKKEEVLNVVEKLVQKIELEKQQRSQELKQRETISQLLPLAESELCLIIMMNLILESDFNGLNDLLKTRIHKGYSLVISLQSYEDHQYDLEKQHIYATIKNFIKLSGEDCIVSPLIGNRITLFTNNSENHHVPYNVKERSIVFAEKIYQFIEREYDIRANIGIGTIQEGLEGLRRSYYEATIGLSNTTKENPIRYYSDRKNGKEKELILNIEEQLFRELNNLNLNQAILLFHQAFDKLIESTKGNFIKCKSEVMELFIALNKLLLRQGVKSEGIGSLSDTTQMEQLRHISEIWFHSIVEAVRKDKESKTESLIDRAKQYMEENYYKEISMELVAEIINLSPYYFSKIFKKMEGITFIDYLTLLRINKAKELLQDQNLSLKEICFQVGYNDPNYFSRVFKKVTELSPTEYRYQVIKS